MTITVQSYWKTKEVSDYRVSTMEMCFLEYFSMYSIGQGNGTPLQYSCLENPMDGGAWWAPVHGVTEGRTRLSDFTFTSHFPAWEKEMATHSSVLAGESQGQGAWWAAVCAEAQSRT